MSIFKPYPWIVAIFLGWCIPLFGCCALMSMNKKVIFVFACSSIAGVILSVVSFIYICVSTQFFALSTMPSSASQEIDEVLVVLVALISLALGFICYVMSAWYGSRLYRSSHLFVENIVTQPAVEMLLLTHHDKEQPTTLDPTMPEGIDLSPIRVNEGEVVISIGALPSSSEQASCTKPKLES